ncbi:hypothetical protein SLE2022_061550 [Rubroshorea leprosula]
MNNCLLAGVSGGGWLEDTSLVEKYKISDEEYNKGDSTFRKFKENLASQNAPALGTKTSDDNMQDLCTNIKAVNRREVKPDAKRGVVNMWGERSTYFDCPLLHGAMVRPNKVKFGNYAERDPFEEDER